MRSDGKFAYEKRALLGICSTTREWPCLMSGAKKKKKKKKKSKKM